ncbi:hypothetical protein EV188_10676 [Actinomycetospora succinea]|uniref:Uncharacterized protein n=1 Tax=Actinomycetospora succinea TaxID=663603 RepID=A0A4R6V4V3_9PSEU|nr:hypothetical protein EV188_10676 [Actinomycetospora succinea]
MRLGRRLSAGIAEDPPAPPETTEVEETREITTTEHREPAEQLVDR